LEDAFKAYEKCLSVAPYHEEAHTALEYLKSKLAGANNVDPNVAAPPKAVDKDPLKILQGGETDLTIPPPVTGATKRDKERKSKKKKDRK